MSTTQPGFRQQRTLGTQPPGSERVIERWLPLSVGAFALFVFALWYWNPAYRYDEYLVALARTRLPWSELLEVIATTDPSGGPLYLLMKPWAALSSDPWWTRIPSLIAMAVAVGSLVAFVRAAVGIRTAFFAGLLMIAVPGSTRWAQDNRMYALATACAVIAVACWWQSTRSGAVRWSVAYGVAVVGMGLFHLYTLTLIPALLLASLWLRGERRSIMLKTLIPPFIALVILLPHVYLNLANPTGSPSNPSLSPRTLAVIAAVNGGLVLTPVLALSAIGGSIWAWRFPRWRAIVVLALTWVIVPLLCFVFARAVLGVPTLVPRYLVFAIPGGCVSAALGLTALTSRWRWTLPLALLVIVLVAVPEQIGVRSVGSHNEQTHRLGLLLRQPELAGLPLVAVDQGTEWTIDAATYPDRLISPSDAAPRPVAVVVRKGKTASEGAPERYLQAGGPWRPVVRCRPGDVVTVEVVARPGATLPMGDARLLARRLNEAVPHAACMMAPLR